MSDVLGPFFEDMGMLGKNGTSYLLGGIYKLICKEILREILVDSGCN